MITGIGHIAITSSDIDASLDFYNRILGLPDGSVPFVEPGFTRAVMTAR